MGVAAYLHEHGDSHWAHTPGDWGDEPRPLLGRGVGHVAHHTLPARLGAVWGDTETEGTLTPSLSSVPMDMTLRNELTTN